MRAIVLFVASVLLFLQPINVRSQNIHWEEAEVVYNNGDRVHGYVRVKKGSYFALMKFKSQIESKFFLILPEDIKEVHTDNYHFYSISFKEDDHFVKSSCFGLSYGGQTIKLLRTQFFYKTCSCNNRGSYRYGWFLWYDNDFVYIHTTSGNLIKNINEINSFLLKHNYKVLDDNSDCSISNLQAHVKGTS